MIATTTIGDVIAIMLVATTLFFLGLVIIWLLKFIFRLISGKPRTDPIQSLAVYFEQQDGWDEEDEHGGQPNVQEMQRFAGYLESKIHTEQQGGFDGGEFDEKGVRLHFFGPDAKLIWGTIESDVRTYAPAEPMEVRFDLGKKRGGREVMDIRDDTPRRLDALPEFEPVGEHSHLSPAWRIAWLMGVGCTLVGLAGLFLSWLARTLLDISEREVMHSAFGSFVIFTLSGLFVGGLMLALVCSSHSQRVARRPNPGPLGQHVQGLRLPDWISNKFILVIVAAVMTLVMILLMEG